MHQRAPQPASDHALCSPAPFSRLSSGRPCTGPARRAAVLPPVTTRTTCKAWDISSHDQARPHRSLGTQQGGCGHAWRQCRCHPWQTADACMTCIRTPAPSLPERPAPRQALTSASAMRSRMRLSAPHSRTSSSTRAASVRRRDSALLRVLAAAAAAAAAVTRTTGVWHEGGACGWYGRGCRWVRA